MPLTTKKQRSERNKRSKKNDKKLRHSELCHPECFCRSKNVSKDERVSSAIHREMRVADILTLLPDSAPLLAEYGLSCFNCSANDKENLADGCRSHGFADEEIQDLITDLNEMFSARPERPQTLTLTKDAAIALRDILEKEGKKGWGLLVGLDEAGGFSMELVEGAAKDQKSFQCADVKDVSIFASLMTLTGIGGSTIDFREGRFKLDLPEDLAKAGGCGCGDEDGGGCGCA